MADFNGRLGTRKVKLDQSVQLHRLTEAVREGRREGGREGGGGGGGGRGGRGGRRREGEGQGQ